MLTPNDIAGLRQGSFRGIAFHAPDISQEAGRRRLEVLFPGLDRAAYEDFGKHPGAIRIEGVIIGADYVARSKQLQKAFEAPGAGTLVHPWLGPMKVLLAEPAEIRFAANALRMVTFSAIFKRAPAAGFGISTLARALGLALSLIGSARALGGAAHAASPKQALRAATQNIPKALSAIALVPSITTRPVAVAATPASLFDALQARVAEVASLGVPRPSPAIGPGPAASAAPAVAPSIAARALLRAARNVPLVQVRDNAASALLSVTYRAMILGEAMAPALEVAHDSRQSALAWRSVLAEALDELANEAALAARLATKEGGEVYLATLALRSGVLADLDERIGRLPSIQTLQPGRQIHAWLLAQHFHGDHPASMLAGFEDIVNRNRLRHPAMAGAHAIEILPPQSKA
jgi:prophage DNA circulation protein